jgi:hypothetical protein
MAQTADQSFEKRMEELSAPTRAQMDANVQAIMDAIDRLELQMRNGGSCAIAELRERVAVLEASDSEPKIVHIN